MNPDWIMAIIAVSAIFSPVISTWLNNKYQLKFKQLELNERCKYRAIEDFTIAFENYYFNRKTPNNINIFEASIANLFIYFSIPNYELFDRLKEYIEINNYPKAQFAISEIVKFLSQQINKT